MPHPFDTVLGNNFTEGCQNFFLAFLANSTFSDCHAFSLLLQVCLIAMKRRISMLTAADLKRLLRCLQVVCSHHADPRRNLQG
jgi:hypothetical protein